MGHSSTILIWGLNHNSDLAEALFNLGYIPIFREDFLPALKTLRHDHFSAVIIDLRNIKADVLEFILNVRDINPHIPVFIVGKSDARLKNQTIWDQLNTFFLIPKSNLLKKQLNQLLSIIKEV